MVVACVGCTFIAKEPINRQTPGISFTTRCELAGTPALRESMKRTDHVKQIRKLWISRAGLRRVVHRLSTGIIAIRSPETSE